ncbi:MAG: DUF4292 domain-containing protein [Bacteroidota bacterium]
MNKTLKYLPIIILLIVSCKARKFSTPVTVSPVIIDTVNQTKILTASDLLASSLKPWTYFSSKADIDYVNGDKKQSVGSNIRMYKDSLIWVSVNMFGIEGARILINKDSMVLLDKFNKQYRVYTRSYIEGILGAPLSVGELQNIILARPVYALELYEIITNNERELKIKNTQKRVFIGHHYQKQFTTIDTTRIDDRTAPHYANVYYSGYVSINNHNFPLNTQIKAYNGMSTTEIKLDFTNPDFDTQVSFSFVIPSSYERVK